MASLSPLRLKSENRSSIPFTNSKSNSLSPRGHRNRVAKLLEPEEYAKAVRGYSLLPTGAGQNHISLADFLNNDPPVTSLRPPSSEHCFVTLYSLGSEDDALKTTSLSPPPRQKPSDSDADPDSRDDKRHDSRNNASFNSPEDFYRHSLARTRLRSSIIFLQGFMSAAWINHIGARHVIDPEFFCRHLDFRPADDNSNNFSIPALPSSSWHLLELSVITIGTRMASKGPMRIEKIEMMRRHGAESLANHHHRISKLSSSGMAVGEPMVREFYVFDETHFATEQRISICMQSDKNGNLFCLLVWLDSGSDFSNQLPLPWSVTPPESYYLPIIRHKPMIALKCHLFKSPELTDKDPSTRQDQFASQLPTDYGRYLRPTTMAHDPFYTLTEVFALAASSQMEFLNLIDIKLDKFTSLPSDQEFQSLPNLKYTKQILYRHIQKTQRVLESINNTKHPRWSKDPSESGSRKAAIEAKNLEQDFMHLLNRATTLHQRTTEAINVLMSSISISESQKAMEQAQRVGKLTFLAFIFVPFSFSTSFFGMNVSELKGNVGMIWWFALTLIVAAGAFALFYFDVVAPLRNGWKFIREWWADMEIGVPWRKKRRY